MVFVDFPDVPAAGSADTIYEDLFAPAPAWLAQSSAGKLDLQITPVRHWIRMPEALAAFKPLPDYEFGAAARKAPVAGGAAKATYLTILFGMVMPHMKIPPGAKPIQGGMVSFGLDETGRLTFAGTKISSGSPELDRAAIAAIRAAAPFPAPPTGRSIGLTFTYGADR